MSSKKQIICIMGPTASGKTPLAVELVQRFPLEIISVDSAMIYRGMDIGTAKPDETVLRIAPHRLINILDPKESYSAGQFRQNALREIENIVALGKTPLLVGGTMLYFFVLQQGLAELPPKNPVFRQEIENRAAIKGWDVLHQELSSVDPIAASRIHVHDKQRIVRALEVYYLTGKTISKLQAEETEPLSDYHIHHLVLAPKDRSILHHRIAERFQKMLAAGFEEEVRQLYARGDLNTELPSIRSVGYRQMWAYLNGEISHEVMREKAIVATRQLAKRQLTWLRSYWPDAFWFNCDADHAADDVSKIVKKIMQRD